MVVGKGDYGCREGKGNGCRGRGETMVVEEGKDNGCRGKRREMVVGEEERQYLRLLFQLRASGHTEGRFDDSSQQKKRGEIVRGDRFYPHFDLTDVYLYLSDVLYVFIRLEHSN